MEIVDFVKKITSSLDNNFTTLGIFFDLSKAFDTMVMVMVNGKFIGIPLNTMRYNI